MECKYVYMEYLKPYFVFMSKPSSEQNSLLYNLIKIVEDLYNPPILFICFMTQFYRSVCTVLS